MSAQIYQSIFRQWVHVHYCTYEGKMGMQKMYIDQLPKWLQEQREKGTGVVIEDIRDMALEQNEHAGTAQSKAPDEFNYINIPAKITDPDDSGPDVA